MRGKFWYHAQRHCLFYLSLLVVGGMSLVALCAPLRVCGVLHVAAALYGAWMRSAAACCLLSLGVDPRPLYCS